VGDSLTAASLIGHATVGAGVGSNPFFVTGGRVYLTGPYRRAPYGLAVAVDAVAGPFNLGTVVVRQAINVNPRTAQLSVVSQPFPTVVKGVVLHIRSVRVAIDKPHFMVSPTNCSKQQVSGIATSVAGSRAPLSSRFQVGGCKNLKFAPKLSLSVGGTGHTRRGNSAPFRAVLTQTPGQSNLKSVSVSLPQTLAAPPQTAEEIPSAVVSTGRGTDEDAIHVSRAGIPTALVSVPLRYVHSPFGRDVCRIVADPPEQRAPPNAALVMYPIRMP
jgi:M42 glutamyl aminopeptidase